MLDETEWASVSPYLDRPIQAIQAYRKENDVDLTEARERLGDLACATYERLTGFHETNYLAIYHHRLLQYGPPCSRCDRLLRTPRASFCAACGWKPGSLCSAENSE